jgi:type I restriction enzyme S subunit
VVPLGDLLRRADESAVLEQDASYHEVTIRLWGKGVVSRGKVRGSDVATQRRFVRSGQLILSKIDARNGALGMVPPELDGAIVSNDFPSFEVKDEAKCLPGFLEAMVKSTWFVDLCKASSEGTTNRVRLKEERFLNQEVQLPPLSEQRVIVAKLNELNDKTTQINAHLDAVESDADRLLALRFHDAIANAPYLSMSEVAPLVRRAVEIDAESSYTELGVRSFYKGTFHRRIVLGAEFTWQKMFRIEQGDLIFSNIMAWEQAIALAKPKDAGCLGNHRMLTCVAKPKLMLPEFLAYYFTTDDGFADVYAASPGTAARNRTLIAGNLEAIQVPVPPLAAQCEFIALQTAIAALKAEHVAIRQSNAALVPATLERIFGEHRAPVVPPTGTAFASSFRRGCVTPAA